MWTREKLELGFLASRSFTGKMSKLSFRARALDATKAMPIYKLDEIPDLPDFAAINRAVPQMPTGMEKEEESVSEISHTRIALRFADLHLEFCAHFRKQKQSCSRSFAVMGLAEHETITLQEVSMH